MNKYARTPEYIFDLHGFSLAEAEVALASILGEKKYAHIRIITGKGTHSERGPVLRDFVKDFLGKHHIRFEQSKIRDGGEGALEVYW